MLKQDPGLTGDQLDLAIAERPHPKVTRESILAKVHSIDFLLWPGTTLTLCRIEMENGFSVLGQSACVDPRNYDKVIGESLAHKDALGKLWPLEGYLLAEKTQDEDIKKA